MSAKKSIEKILQEQFSGKGQLFLFKDKQFLQNGDFAGFAQHRLKEARRAFIGGISFFLMFLFTGISYIYPLVAGTASTAVQIVIISISFLMSVGFLFYSTKVYYSTKSSMTLMLNLLEQEKADERMNANIPETA